MFQRCSLNDALKSSLLKITALLATREQQIERVSFNSLLCKWTFRSTRKCSKQTRPTKCYQRNKEFKEIPLVS